MFRLLSALAAVSLTGPLLAAAASPAHLATGTFEPKVTPVAGADDVLAVSKLYHGGLEASATGKMVGVGDPAGGAASYVVAETVTGALDGRKGSFVFLHRGWIDGGKQEMMADIAPGSGTGALKGITGHLTFVIVGKEHRYRLTYRLPA